MLKLNFLTLARFSLFIIYFWFGILKVFHLSPATPIAEELVKNTVGNAYFSQLFLLLGIYECAIGLLFLFPKTTKTAFYLLALHMLVVISPLVLVPHMTWEKFLLPTLEGQYIIKNVALFALALGVMKENKL